MKADIYADPIKRRTLLERDVVILEISPKPKIRKDGKLFKTPFQISWNLTQYEAARLKNLWEQGIRVATIKCGDGSITDNVWVNIRDIKE